MSLTIVDKRLDEIPRDEDRVYWQSRIEYRKANSPRLWIRRCSHLHRNKPAAQKCLTHMVNVLKDEQVRELNLPRRNTH